MGDDAEALWIIYEFQIEMDPCLVWSAFGWICSVKFRHWDTSTRVLVET